MRKELMVVLIVIASFLNLNCAGSFPSRYRKAVEIIRVWREETGNNYIIAFDENGGKEDVILEKNYQTKHFNIYYTLTYQLHGIPFNKRGDTNGNQTPDIIEEVGEILEYGYTKLKGSSLENILKDKKLAVNIYNFHDKGRTANAVRDETGLLDGISKENISLVLNRFCLLDEFELKKDLFHELVHIFQVYYVGHYLDYSVAENTAELLSEMLMEGYCPSESTMELIVKLWRAREAKDE